MFSKIYSYSRYININTMYILLHFVTIVFLISKNQVFIDINDDMALYYLLINGYSGTLVMSYPLSYVISKLYELFPNIAWLSSLYFFIIIINIYIFYIVFIKQLNQKITKILLTLISVIFYLFIWQHINITVLTILTLSSAIIVYDYRLLFSYILIVLSFLLRIDIAIIFTPFLFISFLLINKNNLFNFKKTIKLCLSILIPLFIHYYCVKSDYFYNEWLEFNKSRAFFYDLKANTDNTNFTEEQKYILTNGWWVQDEELLPRQQLIDNTYSIFKLYQEQIIKSKKINKLIVHKYKFIFFILICFGLFVYFKSKKINILYYFIFIFFVLLLLLLRDVERVTIPLTFLWFLVVAKQYILLKSNNTEYLIRNTFFVVFLVLLIYRMPINFNLATNESINEKKEYFEYLKNKTYSYEPSIRFPQSFTEIDILFSNNILFKENLWIIPNYLPAGWLSRHAIFYDKHSISYDNKLYKYNSFYEWLISEDAYFIGGNILNTIYAQKILKYYDRKLSSNCKHKVKIIDSYKDLVVTKIYIDCKGNK